MADDITPITPRCLIADADGRPTRREQANAYLLAVDLAELSARRDLATVRATMPTRTADLQFLAISQAAVSGVLATHHHHPRDPDVLVDPFDRLRLLVLSAEQFRGPRRD